MLQNCVRSVEACEEEFCEKKLHSCTLCTSPYYSCVLSTRVIENSTRVARSTKYIYKVVQCIMLYNTDIITLYIITLYFITLYLIHCTLLYCTLLHCTLLNCTSNTLYIITLYIITLYIITLYIITLYIIILYIITLYLIHCTLLHCTSNTCQTPTMAFAMRMRRMTNGSTKAVSCSSDSSNHASTLVVNFIIY